MPRYAEQSRRLGVGKMHSFASRLTAVIGWATLSLLVFGTGMTGA